jgi:hypothetical protein
VPAPVAAIGPAVAARPPAPATGFGARLEARLHPAPGASEPTRPLAVAVERVEAAQARLDQLLAAARRGQTFTAGQLLALQAEAYRFTQTLDVAAKVVEQGVQGVKQAIHTPL